MINNQNRSSKSAQNTDGGKEERYQKILALLEEFPYLSVQKLSELLYVSLPTVRRDLTFLQHSGMIVRNHGGARRSDAHTLDIPLEFRNSYKNKEKHALCRTAAQLIHPGDLLFIDASTTLLPLAEELAAIPDVRVVTNSTPAVFVLAKHGIPTYGTGGEILPQSLAFAGADAEDFVRRFRFDAMFFSTYGVTQTGEIVDTSLPETHLRRAVLPRARKKIFVCDGEKFGLSAPHVLCTLADVDAIVTNLPLQEPYTAYADQWVWQKEGKSRTIL